MPSALDNWDAANKAVCFRQFADELRDQAQRVFLEAGTHVELFFLVNDNGQGEVIPAPPKVDHAELFAALRDHLRASQAYGVIHIVESWVYFRQQPGDHTFKQIVDGEIKVSELQPQDKREALVVRMETREGAQVMWVMPIVRGAAKPTLGETITYPAAPGGRFARLFGAG